MKMRAAQIIVRGEQKGNDISCQAEDNGMGMSQEVVDNLLTNSEKVPKSMVRELGLSMCIPEYN